MEITTKSHGPIVTPKRCFHTASWLGISTTAYTNYEAAPNAHLQVAYLAVPVLAACLSEGLIRGWSKITVPVRLFVATILTALLATSYEHFANLIATSGGTWFSAHVGAGVVDLAILGCVVATCTMPEEIVPVPETLKVVPEIVPVPETLKVVPEIVPVPETLKVVPVAVPKSIAPKPTTGKRAENDKRDVAEMSKLCDGLEFLVMSETDKLKTIRDGMNCGGPRATRLVKLYTEHVEREFKGVAN